MTFDEVFAIVAILLLVIIVSGCALLYMLLRNTRFGGASGGAGSGDVTNLMILFQSMRETVEQQKELARQFNLSIDRKVSEVRDALGSSSELKARVSAAQSEIDALVKDTKEQLASLNRRMEYLLEKAPEGFVSDDAPVSVEAAVDEAAAIAVDDIAEVEVQVAAEESAEVVPEVEAETEEAVEIAPEAVLDVVPESPIDEAFETGKIQSTYDGSEKLPPLHAIAASAPKKRDLIDNWAGVDFGIKELSEPAHVPEPDEPEDPESSRDAFRTLLNLKQTETQGDFSETPEGGVSDDAMTPVQRRIYEFSDAGMRVPDIARELGVGKGEVKLILNMRDTQA